jgi:hypothetical protein
MRNSWLFLLIGLYVTVTSPAEVISYNTLELDFEDYGKLDVQRGDEALKKVPVPSAIPGRCVHQTTPGEDRNVLLLYFDPLTGKPRFAIANQLSETGIKRSDVRKALISLISVFLKLGTEVTIRGAEMDLPFSSSVSRGNQSLRVSSDGQRLVSRTFFKADPSFKIDEGDICVFEVKDNLIRP